MNNTSRFVKICLASTALCLASVSVAHAGGFALREQSAYGQGSSFAGVAAGGSPSSMFWNPAVITKYSGKTFEQNLSFVLPQSEIESQSATVLGVPVPGPALRDSGSLGMFGLVPSGASVYQLNNQIYLGLTSGGPFGLATDANNNFSGSIFGSTGKVFSVNITPTIGYRINDTLSVAGGVQVQYFKARLASPITDLEGDDIGFGFTAGLLYTPQEGTDIGIGFRSSVSHKLEGDAISGFNPAFAGRVSTKLKTPETLTLGVRHKLNDRWNVMGGFEWTNWSRLDEAVIQYSLTSIVEDFHWNDGYFASLGAEYAYSDKTTLRAGVGYEWSPVDDSNRGVRIPDADRLWLSAGFSHMFSEKFTMHAGYSLVLAEKGDISLANPALASTFTGESKGHVHILSLGIKAKF